MRSLPGRLVVRSFALLAAAPLALLPLVASSQTYTPPLEPQAAVPQSTAYGARELDQMLAPIALYPDGLLSQILVAATFPEQVVEAARWSRNMPGLEGEAAVQAARNMGWEPSVQSLVAFPQVLQQMERNPEWMRALGHAFLVQEPMVMDAVQDLRRRAQAAGTLQSDEQLRVEQQGQALLIEPAQPQLTYVPYYDPMVAYGTWPWAAYPPVYWAPWAGYRSRPGYRSVFAWGPAVRYSAPVRYGRIDWGQRRVYGDWRQTGPRVSSPRREAPRFETRRSEPIRFGPSPSSSPLPSPSPRPDPRPAMRFGPSGDARHDAFRSQRREEHRANPVPRAAPSAPGRVAPPAAAATPSPHQHQHGQGRGHRGDGAGGGARGDGRGDGRGRS
jgi:hypothetical protein